MPKINVYLPDDLAAAVRESGISVSPVCQRALVEEVRLVGSIRSTVAGLRSIPFGVEGSSVASEHVWGHMTERLRDALRLAYGASDGVTRTVQLLAGILDEGENLGVRVLRELGVDVDELRRAAASDQASEEQDVADVTTQSSSPTLDEQNLWRTLSTSARLAIASALEESVALGHRFLGCEHVLLGLLDVTESGASRILHQFGVDASIARRVVSSAVVGFAHARARTSPLDEDKLDAILSRLEVLENRLG
ncbi:MAG TPA: Clp protease N-terminal domain-containing protein [Acidimicrobiales bacterium]